MCLSDNLFVLKSMHVLLPSCWTRVIKKSTKLEQHLINFSQSPWTEFEFWKSEKCQKCMISDSDIWLFWFAFVSHDKWSKYYHMLSHIYLHTNLYSSRWYELWKSSIYEKTVMHMLITSVNVTDKIKLKG